MSGQGHKYSASVSQNHKAQLTNAYNELGKELSSSKIKVVGNYTLGRVIGEGTYGTVRLGTHRLTSTRVAIKQIPKAMSAALTREIHHHRRLHHPHVCKLYEVIATESYIWLVTELCSGGELFDYLAEKGRLSEDESRTIFGQLCLAVGYIHEKGVVHRDLKLENVLLDERCRVKLGDFGFTREFERGSLLDTYCGTTGYAAPEMLMAKKYLGPEVDVWSLGIILYCLLTGTLPFDDDDESIMREKIILGEFETPVWLSPDARDLLRNILQHDPAKRLTIPQILAHPWFSRPVESYPTTDATHPAAIPSPTPAENANTNSAQHLPSPSTSEASFHSASCEPSPGPDETSFSATDNVSFDSNASESTIKQKGKKCDVADPASRWKKSSKSKSGKKSATNEGGDPPVPAKLDIQSRENSRAPSPGQPAPPTSYPIRTPVRTKRRSVSSILSQPSSPVSETHHEAHYPPQDFAALLRTPAPLLFSTPLERSLLNSLSTLGFDIGQMVHSVLSDACDASGAIWWMLKRKAEKKALEVAFKKVNEPTVQQGEAETEIETELENNPSPSPGHMSRAGSSMPDSPAPAVDQSMRKSLDQSHSAPELTLVPATPTAPDSSRKKATSPPVTPPRSKSPRGYLSPTPTSMDSIRSNQSTPSSKDREKEAKDGSKGRNNGKPRSGSIVQRATMTALEAAGLVRKRSAEAVKEKEKEREREKEEREKEKDKDRDRASSSTTDSKNGHANGPNRLTKSPPMRPVKDTQTQPSTPEHDRTIPTSLPSSSPWVPITKSSTFAAAPTPANSPGNTNDFGDSSHKLMSPVRNRSSLLTTFRMWFNEDRKGKRKAAAPPAINISASTSGLGVPPSPRTRGGTFKRRGGWSAQKARAKRASISSRRSSSVNSRRSSVASMQMVLMETPHHGMPDISRQRSDPSRRSFTPNSEVEREVQSSRPSSIRSYSMQNGKHRKSTSGGSSGYATPLKQYHRRAGSASSTRVVRQTRASQLQKASERPAHVRSNSTTSSIHSLQSSRPGSFYDASEGEGQTLRTGSPFRSIEENGRRGSGYNTVLLAQKKHSPLGAPYASSFMTSVSRSSWKKAWGIEPPGWQSRPSQFPVEVLAISGDSDQPMTIRDVFSSGRQSINLGDESDWVDEDDEFPAFVGGLGQIGTNFSSSKTRQNVCDSPIQFSPAPRASNRNPNMTGRRAGRGRGGGARSRAGHSPIGGTMPLPGSDGVFDVAMGPKENAVNVNEPRMSRRQLPNGRSAPAFRSAIVEEDEEEEE